MNSGQLNNLVIQKTVHLLFLSQPVLASLLSPQLDKPILLQRTETSYPPPSLKAQKAECKHTGESVEKSASQKGDLYERAPQQ